MVETSPWWAPHVHADRRPLLIARRRILAAARQYFETRGFTEVEAAILAEFPEAEVIIHEDPAGHEAPQAAKFA